TKANGLAVVTTPPLTASGAAPSDPAYRPAPELPVLLKSAFEAEPGDRPTVETIGKGEIHALLAVGTIQPAAPIPLPQGKDRVRPDLVAQRTSDRAKAMATAIVAKSNGGRPLADAVTESGLKVPPPQPLTARQIDVIKSGRQAPPPIAMLFNLATGK